MLRYTKRASLLVLLLAVLKTSAASGQTPAPNSLASAPVLASRVAKPGTYWWWMGSAVDTLNLRKNLQALSDAGIGGVLVIPIYGVKGYEDRFLNYLSPEWLRAFAFTVRTAGELGMWVDMTTGTGWPFGGSHVTEEFAAKRLTWTLRPLPSRSKFDTTLASENLVGAFLLKSGGGSVDLTDSVLAGRRLIISPGPGKRRLLVVRYAPTGQHVKRAAPGNEGLVLDPFSPRALRAYVQRFDTAFAHTGAPWPRAQYHDSFEYYKANWTADFLAEFGARRGYDLRPLLPALLGYGDPVSVARVKHDYRQTLSDLHLAYIRAWVDWAHDHGCLTRNQAHGAPGNLLDLYAAADIPETEAFGSPDFPIPGFRRAPENVGTDVPDPLVFRFASSAAHVSGRRLVASETCTWLREHFKTALSQVKPEIDQLFCAGINHIFYHGNAYSPADAPWPGWLFYASVHFQAANPFWRDFPALNAYVERCQSALQSGQPDNDLLIYWPVHDLWQDTTGLQRQLTVHDTWWLRDYPYGLLADSLVKQGVTFDFVSDRLLSNVRVDGGQLVARESRYTALLVPSCRVLPLATWWKLLELVRSGATVLFHGDLPADVPGLLRYRERRAVLQRSQSNLHFQQDPQAKSVRLARLGRGRLLVSESARALLSRAGVVPEEASALGLQFIRRVNDDGWTYFLANLSARRVDGWLRLSRPCRSALLVDPLTGRKGLAAARRDGSGTRVYVQLEPGQSCLLQLARSRPVDAPAWEYTVAAGPAVPLKGTWRVTFVEGGPVLPAEFTTDRLGSWTEFADSETRRFAGTARYTLSFRLPEVQADDWLLQLGDVRESARVRVNGTDVGVLWSLPFQARVGRFLEPGWNTLQVEVTNLAANRIRDLDRRGVPWKRFYDINFVNIRYQPFDASGWEVTPSGLLGPVRLVPLKRIWPGEK